MLPLIDVGTDYRQKKSTVTLYTKQVIQALSPLQSEVSSDLAYEGGRSLIEREIGGEVSVV